MTKTTGNTTTVYPNDLYARTTDGTNATTTRHIFDNSGTLLATIEGAGTATSTHFIHPDHLSSTNVVTDSGGNTVQTLDYYPYGSPRIDTTTASFDSSREYIGEHYDEESSLSYLNARYYAATRGQFTSQDPMFWTLSSDLLADPQQQNAYAYARNNPINRSDPSGLLTVIIPGTNHNKKDWSRDGKAKDFIKGVEKTFGEDAQVINDKSIWSGADNSRARRQAANNIVNIIKGHSFADGEQLNIVGHSHGGNIAILVSQGSDRKIDNLVTLGTPSRSQYTPNYSMIGNHVNVYSTSDGVQRFLGGRAFSAARLLGQALLPASLESLTRLIPYYGEFGPAGQTFDGAENVSVSSPSWVGAHSNLWSNPDVWSEVDGHVTK